MLNNNDRSAVKKYFFGDDLAKWLLFGGLALIVLNLVFLGNKEPLMLLGLALMAGALAVKVYRMFPNAEGEHAVDQQMVEDRTDLSVRALDKLGLVEDQVSLIEPIMSYGPYYGVTSLLVSSGNSKKANKLFNLDQLVFRYGGDEVTRYSLVQYTYFYFTEDQVMVYTCGYNLCTGQVYEEHTSEYFYQDVDCVTTGSRTQNIIVKKSFFSRTKVVTATFENFGVVVNSGSKAIGSADGNADILDKQIMAMRALVRSKKMEMTL